MAEPILFGFPNRIDSMTLSAPAGAFVATLPLALIQTRLISEVARTVDTDPANTQWIMDYERSMSARVFSMINHGASLQARYRVTASNKADFSEIIFTNEDDVWGGLVNGSWNLDELEWENNNFWMGTYSTEEIEGYTPTSIMIFDRVYSARYWKVEILDPTNPKGYFQIGRVFIGPVIAPTLTYQSGSELGYETTTEVEEARGGGEFFDVHEATRVFRFQLANMRGDEAHGVFQEFIRRAGIDQEVLLIADPSDKLNSLRRNFLGRFKQMSALQQMSRLNGFATYGASFEIKELR